MSYQTYVIAAYAVFVVVMLWEFVSPKVQIGQLLRAARLRVKRDHCTPKKLKSHDRHPGEGQK